MHGASRNLASFSHKEAQAGPNRQLPIPDVQRIIAIASGKGGVGKSTVTVNLAIALAARGLRVGLLDADIYGPSVPLMMNLCGPPQSTPDGLLVPLVNYDVKCMSIGFLIPDGAPTVWRGPMVTSALHQMLHKVAWGVLDILLLDMPPGTGDTQLSIAQLVPITGVIIVSTPQDVALIDAERGANMFQLVNVPILGLVENMSYYECPACGDIAHIFGAEGAQSTANRMGLPLLGGVPLHYDIREACDLGNPIAFSAPSSPQASSYHQIAATLSQQVLTEHVGLPNILQ